jgi:hypothetical protein
LSIILFPQSSYWAGFNALSAVNAVNFIKTLAKYRFDYGLKPLSVAPMAPMPCTFSAGGNAAFAKNAFVGIPNYGR